MVDFASLNLKLALSSYIKRYGYYSDLEEAMLEQNSKMSNDDIIAEMCRIVLSNQGNNPQILTQPVEVDDKVEEEPIKLSEDQEKAWELIKAWSNNSEPHFILRGWAGTGKSYLLKQLKTLNKSIFYSAPTNKAAKVLGKYLGQPTKTTFSLFGLRLEHEEDEVFLKKISNPPYFPPKSIIVVDESSMVGSLLFNAIEEVRESMDLKILYVGDPLQLPPVKELRSPAWQVTKDPQNKFTLKKIMRYDNELLKLATDIRECITDKEWRTPLNSSNNDGMQGIWLKSSREAFIKEMLKQITPETMQQTKVIAWRNKIVTEYNEIIRRSLGFYNEYNVGDSILLAEPIEEKDQIIAHTDDEFIIKDITPSLLAVDLHNIEVYKMEISGDQELTINVPMNPQNLDYVLGEKAKVARQSNGYKRKELWREFWKAKSQFHSIRFGYALTAHRAQGSTYETCFVDQHDILANPTKREAFRCLYVAATRASDRIISY